MHCLLFFSSFFLQVNDDNAPILTITLTDVAYGEVGFSCSIAGCGLVVALIIVIIVVLLVVANISSRIQFEHDNSSNHSTLPA